MQTSSESASEYIARLRTIANDCEFTDFENALLDQFLVGLKDQKIQSKLLSEKNLTLKTAIEKVLSCEKANIEAQIMHGSGESSTNFVRKKQQKFVDNSSKTKKKHWGNQSVKCAKCELPGHSENNCRTKCYKCGKLGHIKNQCRSHTRRVHQLECEDDVEESESESENLSNLQLYHVVVSSESELNLERAISSDVEHRQSNIEFKLSDSIPIYSPVIDDFQHFIKIKSKVENIDDSQIDKVENIDLFHIVNDDDKIDNFHIDDSISVYAESGIVGDTHNTAWCIKEEDADLVLTANDPALSKIAFDSYHTELRYPKPVVQALINGKSISMEFDSGSTVSVCCKSTIVSAGIVLNLFPSSKTLKVANGEITPVLGCAPVTVTANGSTVKNLQLYVVEGSFPSLFGTSWINAFCGPDWMNRVWNCDKLNVKKPLLARTVVTVEDNPVVKDSQDVLKDLVSTESSSVVLSTPCLHRKSSLCEVAVPMSPCKLCVEVPCTCNKGRTSDVCMSFPSPIPDCPDKDCQRSVKDPFQTSDEGETSLKLEAKSLRSVEELKRSSIFQSGLGLVRDVEAKLVLKKDAKPIMLKSRSLPFSMRSRVEEKLESMVADKILEKIEDSPWGTPIVPVLQGEKLRICGDYKSTLNKVVETREYPLPSLEDCFTSVAGSTLFSVVDIKQAYNNMMIRESDQILTTLNTHRGLYKWLRLPYGISSSAAIFQGTMDQVLRGIPYCCCRIDDILIGGRSEAEHLEILNEVITRLEDKGFRCRLEKSQIAVKEVVYLGHRVSPSGIQPLKSKIRDLMNAPKPENVEELVSFLSAVNYYRRYLPNLSTVIGPLDDLRKHEVKWKWTTKEQNSFDKLKELLCSERVLTFYNPDLPLKVDTDASSTGLGAVLSHLYPNGEERPIEYISRTLSQAERNYAQIDREALGIVWAIKRFHIYLYMRKFLLVTDHQALVHLFKSSKAVSTITTRRIARWALFLSNYDYEIQYRNTKLHGNCDMLSRLPRAVTHSSEKDECAELFSLSMQESMLDAELVARETRKDAVLSKVLSFTLNGWPPNIKPDGEMRAYCSRKDEISVELGCLMWGARVIIPSKLRKHVLNLLHVTHMGMAGTKSLARSYAWWSNLDSDIETMVRACETCSRHGKSMPKLQDHPWTKASGPFQRVHIDYAGPFLNQMWLVVQDSYSKWPEVIRMNKDSSAPATVKALRHIFSRTGIPMTVVSDNGPQFVAEETKRFLQLNGVKHVTCPTYSPKSNGLCERFVGTFKAAIKKMTEKSRDLDMNLANFLLTYRNTPHSITKQPPAVLMYNRTLRFNLQQIKPADKQIVETLQHEAEQKVLDQPSSRRRSFTENQPVWVQIDKSTDWKKAKIVKRCYENSNVYEINYKERLIKKHADHLKNRLVPVITMEKETPENLPVVRAETERIIPDNLPVIEAETREKTPGNLPTAKETISTGDQNVSIRNSARLAEKNRVNYRE